MLPTLFVFAVLAVLGSLTGAQNIPANCDPETSLCNTLTTTLDSDHTTRVSLSFYYEPTGTTTGQICYVQSLSVTGLKNAPGSGVTADPQDINGVGNTVTFSQVPGGGTTIDNIILAFTSSNGASTFGSLTASAITAAGAPTSPGGNAAVTLGKVALGPVDDATALTDFCTASGVADPLFTGFLGQKFVLKGEDGGVYNVLSTPQFQLNARLSKLFRAQSMDRSQMKMARLKSLFSLPDTHWFDHDGPYMTELGVVVAGGHQLYAKVGSYMEGWSIVQLDGVNFTSNSVVFGSGDESITISRPNTHQIAIDTASVQLVVSNSANFFNVDKARLKQPSVNGLGGVLGATADPEWKAQDGVKSWEREVEAAAVIESGDLFTASS